MHDGATGAVEVLITKPWLLEEAVEEEVVEVEKVGRL